MKKLLIIIFIISMCSFVLADGPKSMRSVASNGVFDGAWEKVYDPIKLNGVDKMYFFTNFADFNVKYSDVYGDLANMSETNFFEEFPAGIAFTNPIMNNLKHAFFIRFRNTESPEYLGSGNYGEYEEYVTAYQDITGDDIYDIKTITHNCEEGVYENERKFDFIWNNNLELANYNLGIKISSFSSSKEFDNLNNYYGMGIYNFGNIGLLNGFEWDDHQQDIQTEYYELGEEDYYLNCSEKGDFSTVIADHKKELQISMEMDNNLLVEDSSLRIDFGVEMHNDLSRDTTDEYNASYENIVEEDGQIETGFIDQIYKREIEVNETDLYVSTMIKKNIESVSNNGFWETGIDFGIITGNMEISGKEQLHSEEKIESEYPYDFTSMEVRDLFTETNEDGNNLGAHCGAHFLVNLPLNEFSIFGFGGYYNFRKVTGDYDYRGEILNVQSYQEGFEMDESDEYIETETEMITADKQAIISNSNLRVPIALEFKIPEDHTSSNDGFGLRNFAFRLGTTFLYNVHKTENTYDVIRKVPNLVLTEFGDGVITEEHDGDNQLNSNKEIILNKRSSKVFSGGIGYKHSENLCMDFGCNYNYDTEDYLVGFSITISR